MLNAITPAPASTASRFNAIVSPRFKIAVSPTSAPADRVPAATPARLDVIRLTPESQYFVLTLGLQVIYPSPFPAGRRRRGSRRTAHHQRRFSHHVHRIGESVRGIEAA